MCGSLRTLINFSALIIANASIVRPLIIFISDLLRGRLFLRQLKMNDPTTSKARR